MSDFVFNISRGRAVEFYRRVDGNDPANAALIEVVLAGSGLEPDDTLRDYADLAAILAASNNEPGQAQYNRKTWTDSDLSALSVDNANDLVRLPGPTATWTSVVAGDSWAKVLWCYDADTTSGTDANIIPIVAQDMFINGSPIIPAGVNVQWSVPNGWYVSSV